MSRSVFARSLIVASALAAASLAAAAVPSDPPRRLGFHLDEGAAQRETLRTVAERVGADKAADSWAPLLAPSPIDVLSYRIDLALDLAREVAAGTVELTLAAVEDGLTTVRLDADQGLRILGVTLLEDEAYAFDSSQTLSFTHADDVLELVLPRALAAGDTIRLAIPYGGHASRLGQGINWGRHGGGAPIIHTEAEPFGARVWFPCNDRPDDKAVVELALTAPDWLTVASNGLESSRVEHPNGSATTTWSSRYPVATYLVVMNLSDFDYSELEYTAGDGTVMPVVLYAYPHLSAQAQQDLAVTPTMIDVLADSFGEYPFVEEKYGNCTTPFGGGMEHQTLTTIAASVVGDPWMEWLNVHELGHQWWGDWVTCDDWRELWLNEGFASYTEWLWAEHQGEAVLAQLKEDADWIGHYVGALYDNPVAFSGTVYDKGAWTAHMLRQVVGDEDFFQALIDFREAHAAGTATSEDLRNAFESRSGMDLRWFFDQWVYGENRPRMLYSWSQESGPTVRLTVEQKHSNAGFFQAPLEVLVEGDGWSETTTVWMQAEALQHIDIAVPGAPTRVVPNPNNQLLCELAHASEPDLDLGPDFPGPFDAGLVMTSSSSEIRVPLNNVGGSELIISEIVSWSGGSTFSVRSPAQLPLAIAPGSSSELVIDFAPRSVGLQSDYLFILSNDPSHDGQALVRVEGSAGLFANPYAATVQRLDLGSAPVGGSTEVRSSIANLGAAELSLEPVVSGDGFALASSVPASLGAGSRSNLFIRFTPRSVGDHQGALMFATNDPLQPTVTIALTGEGVAAPMLEVTPPTVNLGGASTAEAPVRLANVGTADLTIWSVEVGSPFDLRLGAGLPVTLAPAESLQLSVFADGSFIGSAAASLSILSDDAVLPLARVPVKAFLGGAGSVSSVIAAAASSAGIGGALWSTDLVLLNPGATDHAVSMGFRPAASRGSSTDLLVTVQAGVQRTLQDAVTAAGHTGTGGIALDASSPELVVVSRTFSSESNGTFGQLIPAVASGQAQVAGESYLLPGLAAGGFHTNFGALNLGAQPVSVDFALFDAAGTALGGFRLEAAAGAYAQKVDGFSGLAGGPLRGAYAILSSPTAGARYAAYASVVDDGSHDPTYVQPVAVGADAATELVIPVVASNPGELGTRWRSELSVVHPGDGEWTAELVLHRADGSSPPPVTLSGSGADGVHVADVVGDSFASTGAGWIEISSDAPLVAFSRSYNDAADGTFGQAIPAVARTAGAVRDQVLVLPGLRSDDGFRTNLGFASLSDQEQTVSVELFADSGAALGVVQAVLPAHGFVQLRQLLSEELGYLGRAWARLSSGDAGAAYLAHASVIDGTTGDPIFIPATPLVAP